MRRIPEDTRAGGAHKRCGTKRHIEGSTGIDEDGAGSNDGDEDAVIDDVGHISAVSSDRFGDIEGGDEANKHHEWDQIDPHRLVRDEFLEREGGAEYV